MATKFGQNKPKLHRFQFSTRYGNNVCVYGRLFGVGKFKYANKNFKGQRELPWQPNLDKNPKVHRFQFCTRYDDNFYVHDGALGL